MGVNPTPTNYKTFTFDGTNSRSYGVYITGEGVFNAPERNVEMVEIPGRNGAYALDKGNFKNIEITYPAGIFADTETDFADAVSDLRNFLCSKVGYVRLEDDYNTGEYRLAIYKSGLEVSHDMLTNGEFDITFECKPQRFLTSGETAVAVASGGTLTNPTLFPSNPMLELTGYGNISIGGNNIAVDNGLIGVIVVGASGGAPSLPKSFTFDDTYANTGDTITLLSVDALNGMYAVDTWDTITNSSLSVSSGGYYTMGQQTSTDGLFTFGANNLNFVYGTSSTKSVVLTATITSSNYGTLTGTLTVTVSYTQPNTFTISVSRTQPNHFYLSYAGTKWGETTLDSTQYSLGSPLYVDLDIGEAYKIENGSAVSVNNSVEIPAELPTLPSGNTTITYDNTFTQVKVVPRWWKV